LTFAEGGIKKVATQKNLADRLMEYWEGPSYSWKEFKASGRDRIRNTSRICHRGADSQRKKTALGAADSDGIHKGTNGEGAVAQYSSRGSKQQLKRRGGKLGGVGKSRKNRSIATLCQVVESLETKEL